MNTEHMYEILFKAVQTGSVKEVQKAASKIFNSAVSVVDSAFKVLSADNDPGSTEDMLEKSSEHIYVSKNLMDLFREHNLVYRLNNERNKVILVNWGFFKDNPHITTGIYSGDKILGSIVVLVDSDIITSEQEEALLACANALALVIQSNEVGRKMAGVDRDLYSSKLFTNTILPTDIQHIEESDFFQHSERYVVLATDLIPPQDWQHHLADMMHNLIYVNDNIFYVLSDANELSVSDFQIWLSNRGYRYGLSHTFNDLALTKKMASQARAALRFGNRTGQNTARWDFNLAALKIIANQSSENVDFLHPAALEIKKYDQINHTDYLITLNTWLNNKMDYAETAQVLHLHRNSLYYRIQRIQELFDLNLSDMNTNVQLYLSILSEAND